MLPRTTATPVFPKPVCPKVCVLDVFSVRSENNKNIYLIKKMFALEQPEVCSNTNRLWPDRFSQRVLKTLQCSIAEGVRTRKEKTFFLRLGNSLLINLVELPAERGPVHLSCSGAHLAGHYFPHEKRTKGTI